MPQITVRSNLLDFDKQVRAINRGQTGRSLQLPDGIPNIAALFNRIKTRYAAEVRKFYRRQLIRDIDVVTTRRTGRLRRVRTRTYKREATITITADFPQTQYGGGQYAFVVSARRKFISHAKGVTNARAPAMLARAVAITNQQGA